MAACDSKPATTAGTTISSESKASEAPNKSSDKVYTLEIGHAQPTTNPRHVSLEKI